MNSEIEIKLRKFKNNLAIGGRGYIIFGVWSIIKLLMQLSMGEQNFKSVVTASMAEGVSYLFAMICTIVVIVLICSMVMIVHLMVGLNAIRFGKGKNNRKRFFAFTTIVALINLLGFSIYPVGLVNGFYSVDIVFIASILVDLSVVFILIDLFYSAVMIEKLIKQISVDEEV